jgi:hypothetical protein
MPTPKSVIEDYIEKEVRSGVIDPDEWRPDEEMKDRIYRENWLGVMIKINEDQKGDRGDVNI